MKCHVDTVPPVLPESTYNVTFTGLTKKQLAVLRGLVSNSICYQKGALKEEQTIAEIRLSFGTCGPADRIMMAYFNEVM